MALWERWYMHDRGSDRQARAWRRHRLPERVVDFDLFDLPPHKSPVPRKRGRGAARLRQWLVTGVGMGIGTGMVVAASGLLWSGKTVKLDLTGIVPWLRQALHELRVLACN